VRIYRFVPDDRGFRSFVPDMFRRWWPEGLSMPRTVERMYLGAGPAVFAGYPDFWPIGDLAHYHLLLPAWSDRADRVLGGLEGIAERTTAQFDGERLHVVRPVWVEHAIDLDQSEVIAAPTGEVLAFAQRQFRPQVIQHDVFWAGPMPYPDVYVSDRFVQAAHAAGLTGAGRLALVWDDGPCGPPYPPTEPGPHALDYPSLRLELALLHLRGELAEVPINVLGGHALDLARSGWIPAPRAPDPSPASP